MGGYARYNFDLELHARIGKAGLDHRCGRPYFAECLPQRGSASREILSAGQNIDHPHNAGDRGACLGKRRFDIAQRLFALLNDIG